MIKASRAILFCLLLPTVSQGPQYIVWPNSVGVWPNLAFDGGHLQHRMHMITAGMGLSPNIPVPVLAGPYNVKQFSGLTLQHKAHNKTLCLPVNPFQTANERALLGYQLLCKPTLALTGV